MEPAIIAEYREMVEESMLTDTALILKSLTGSINDPSEASDGRGGVNLEAGGAVGGFTEGETCKCRVLIQGPSAGQGEALVSNSYATKNLAIVVLPYNVSINTSDRIVVTFNSTGEVVTYDVLNFVSHSDMLTRKVAVQEAYSAH